MAHSVYVCSAHEIALLPVNALDRDLSYKDLIKKIVLQHWEQWMRHALVWILSCHCHTERISPSVTWRWWEIWLLSVGQYWAVLTTFTATYKEHKETLIDVIDNLTRHSYIAKLNITSSWYRTKSKATTGVKKTASYIPWWYTTWYHMVVSNMIHCVLPLMATTITQAFCVKFKQFLFIILKLITNI